MALLLLDKPTHRTADTAAREAWGIAADGFVRALRVAGLDAEERGGLLRCLRSCEKAAERASFSVVRAD